MNPTARLALTCFLPPFALLGCPDARSPRPPSTVSETVDAAPTTENAPSTGAATAEVGFPPQGWAQRVCGRGPHATPSGTLQAEPLPNAEPTALDVNDTAFHLYEGAVWFDGALHFSDFLTTEGFPSRVLRYENGRLSVAIPDSGSNGLALDSSGMKLALARHSIKGVSVRDPSGESVVVAAQYEGKPFNSPNDLVFRSDGNLYFTDPSFQAGPNPSQSSTSVYRVAPDGSVTVVDASLRNPNGIALSPDEATLYVAGNMEQGRLVRYPVARDGSVGAGETLLDGLTVPDGLAVDCAGNLYVTEHTERRIRVLRPDGTELARITGLDQNVTNGAFGGPANRTLFITTTGRLYSLELPLPGAPY